MAKKAEIEKVEVEKKQTIGFNRESVFNLKPIPLDDVHKEINDLLIDGEQCVLAFQTVRDQLVFTNKRIVSIDVQKVTGKKKSFTTLPYSRIQYFTIQTPGFAELISDSELFIMFSDGTTATFEIKGKTDIGCIGRLISEYVL